MRAIVTGIFVLFVVVGLNGPSLAQDTPGLFFSPKVVGQKTTQIANFMEGLPPKLQKKVDKLRAGAAADSGLGEKSRGVADAFQLWPPNLPALCICFFGGSPSVRERIANVAMVWMLEYVNGQWQWLKDTRIPFDFGNLPNLRSCPKGGQSQPSNQSDSECDRSGVNHIRIGFDEPGYWSLVGTGSIIYESQSRKSMNFQGFDSDPKFQGQMSQEAEAEFIATVIHEFGHALGLYHEHQNPLASCEAEYDWDTLYDRLSQPPNEWSKSDVDRNLRSVHERGVLADRFDPDSVMIYSFPDYFYKRGRQSSCYVSYRIWPSAGDRQMMRTLYPANAATAKDNRRRMRAAILEKALEGASEDERAALMKKLEAAYSITGGE